MMRPENLYAELLGQIGADWQGLPDKPEETPHNTLRALWFTAAGEPRSAEAAQVDDLPALSEDQITTLRSLVQQRLDGAPLAHLTGRQQFMGLEMLAGAGALIPRKETEIVGRLASYILKTISLGVPVPRLIDICTGSGNLALTLASLVPQASVEGSDLSPEAVELARDNARFLGLEQRVRFHVGDLFAPFEQESYFNSLDMVVCNPPYISSGRLQSMPGEIIGHEPSLAFDGGSFGISILMRLIQDAPRFLKPGGWLAFEVGLGQGKPIQRKLDSSGHYQQIIPALDQAGEVRALAAQTK